MDLITKLPSIR